MGNKNSTKHSLVGSCHTVYTIDLTSIGCELARASRFMALAYSRLRKYFQMSNSGWVWSTHRYSIQVAKPSLSHRCVHHSIVTWQSCDNHMHTITYIHTCTRTCRVTIKLTNQVAKPLVGKFMSDHQCHILFDSCRRVVRINQQSTLPAITDRGVNSTSNYIPSYIPSSNLQILK